MLAGIVVLSMIALGLLVLYRNGTFGYSHPRADILSSRGAVFIRVNLSRPVHVKAGQYINLWICMPSQRFRSLFESHPFVVVSWSDRAVYELDLLIEPRSGFTRDLLRVSKTKVEPYRALFSGPHGNSIPLGNYEVVLMIASGYGIAAQLPYLKQLIHGYNSRKARSRRVHLVWELKTLDLAAATEWVLDNALDEDTLDNALEYRNPRRDGAGGSTRNIDAIERMFRQENGCRKEDSRHHAKAVISPQMLEAALRNAGISGEKLMSDALPFYELEFDPGLQIECIEGHDRLAAADNVLYGSKTRWIVDLYSNDISDDLRLLLSDGFDYQKPPDDGTYYVTIRSFQGHHGEKNRFFENLWLGRLATNANKRDMFDQLSTDKILCSSFDELLEIPALFGGFWLGSIHHLIRMKCPELHRSYLNHTFKWWHDICGGEKAAMRLITREDVEALEGKAPGACAADARSLFSQVMGGEVFGNFARSRREEIWSLVCSSSQRCLIPSLTTFFNDRKLLHDAIDSIKKILDFGDKPTLNSSLQGAFKDADQRQDRCIIQLSETTFGSVAGDAELRKHLAIRQIWLAAIRNYTELPAEPQKSSTMALSRRMRSFKLGNLQRLSLMIWKAA
ncbi:hypothetical protein MY5147_004063 [Beauveria neobassiana]